MTAALTIALTLILLIAALLLGQLPTAAKRLTVVFVACGLASWLVGKADEAGLATDAVMIGVLVVSVIGGLALTWWLLQPWLWGIEDLIAERDAQEEQP